MAEEFDFTGQNIEDTYQRIVQTDGTNFYDGTGSAVSIGGSQDISHLAVTGSDVTFNHITSSGNISASGTIHANLSSGTSNYIVVYDDGELKTDFVDSDIFQQNLVTYFADLGPPQTPANNQVAIWNQAGELKGISEATIDRDGIMTVTALTASLASNDQSFIGYLNVGKLSIGGKIVGDHDGFVTKIGNSNDTSTTIQSPKLVATNLKFTGDLEGSVDGGTF